MIIQTFKKSNEQPTADSYRDRSVSVFLKEFKRQKEENLKTLARSFQGSIYFDPICNNPIHVRKY